jgi:hypothetical protein
MTIFNAVYTEFIPIWVFTVGLMIEFQSEKMAAAVKSTISTT